MTHHQKPANEGVDLGCEGQEWVSFLCVLLAYIRLIALRKNLEPLFPLPGIGRAAVQLMVILPCLVPDSDPEA